MKPSIKYIIPLVLVSSSVLVYAVAKNQPQKTTDNNPQNSSSSNQDSQLNQNINLQKLSVLPDRCRGCGKCVRIDGEHFEMSGRQATVVSSTNLNSSNLALAINNCPAQAITLE
jgi:ferredoxin